MKFGQKHVLMNAAPADGGDGGGGQPPANQAPASGEQNKAPESPNKDWKNDPKLDDKGNPVAEAPKGDQQKPNKKKPPESTNTGEDDKGDKGNKEDKQEPREYDLSAPVVKQVEKLITEAGLNAQDVARIVTENEGKATPELIKALADKHGDAVASIVAEQLSGFHSANQAKANKRDQAIFDQVQESFKGVTEQGGKETWGELAGWAKENIPNDERKEINKLLAQGGIAAKYAVDDLVSRFKSSESFSQSADLITGDATAQDFGVKPLSKQEYVSELRKLEAKGHVYGKSQEMAALDKRRTAGLQRGI